MRAAVSHAVDAAPADAVRSWLLAVWLEASAGSIDVARADLHHAEVVVASLDDARLRADLDRHRAFVLLQDGRPAEALDAARRSLDVEERLGLAWEAAGSSNLAAYAAMSLGDTVEAERSATAAWQRRIELVDDWGRIHADAMLGRIAAADGRLAEAGERLTRSAASATLLGFAGQTALHLTSLGHVEQMAGDHGRAIGTLEQAMAAAVEAGDGRMAATARLHLAQSLDALGREGEATSALQRNLDWYAASGGGDGHLASRLLLGEIGARHHRTGDR